jgi:lipopolysaccharide transport system permease protein
MRKLLTLIRNTPRALIEPFRSLYRHRALVRLLVAREFANRTSQTVLGGAWLFIQPVLQFFALWFLFDFILRVRMPDITDSYANYLMVALVPWFMISELLNRSLEVMREFASLYQRTRFPMELLPLVPILLSVFIYSVVYFFILLILDGPKAALISVLIIPVLGLLLIPLCYLLAVIGVFIQDLARVISFFITLAFYLTPILYTPEMVPEAVRGLFVFNPIADLMAVIRGLFFDLEITPGNVLRPLAVWIFLLAPGWLLYRRMEPHVREAL